MLVPISRLLHAPVLSLQTGAELARIDKAIVDPRQLLIAAFRVNGKLLDHTASVLRPEDIREISDLGIIIDSSDQLMSLEGLVRLQKVIDFGFELNNLRVEDELGHKLGHVESYAIELNTFTIQQIYVRPSFLKSLSVSTLSIRRTQVVSVDNNVLTVKSTGIKESEPLQNATRMLTNPFRGTATQQPEASEVTRR